MAINTDGIDPVIESSEDKAHRVTRALIGALPMFSGTALEIFNSVIAPPLEKRKIEWMLEITKVVNDLQENINIETLARNEQFISILLSASQIAIKNHQSEKINALKSALINTAKNTKLTEDQQFTFLSLIDEFTPTHISILKHTYMGFGWTPAIKVDNHSIWLEFSRILLRDISSLKRKGDYIHQIVNELQNKKLFHTFTAQSIQKFDNGEISVMGTSEWGQFLSFKPANHSHMDLNAKYKYVTMPTELGIEFLNYVCSFE